MISGLLFIVAVTVSAAQAATTDLSFVSCWPKHNDSGPQSRSVKSAIVVSPDHWRAYAIVKTNAENGSCRNTTALYVARPGHVFIRVFGQSAENTQDGNGVRILGWSPDGDRLLAEVTNWAYGSDAPPDRAVLVYDSQRAVQKLDHPGGGLQKRLGNNCLFDFSVVGWWRGSTILLRVQPFREELDNRQSCLTRPLSFAYSPDSGVLQLVKTRSMRDFH